MTQAWLDRRFAGLTPQSFVHAVFTFSVEELRPPPLFNEAWCSYNMQTSVVSPEVLQQYEAILIFSSPCNQNHMTGLRSLVSALNESGEVPPVLWVPHTVAPEERSDAESFGLSEGNLWAETMALGLDDIIHDEPEGANLVVAVCARIQTSTALARMLNEVIWERRTKSEEYNAVASATHDILWCQLLVRCAPAVPPVDFNLPSGELRSVPGYSFGRVLGQGSFCTVYTLLPLVQNSEAGAGEGEVIKLVNKSRLKEPERIKQLGRMAEVMVMLNENWKHPNITSLTAIYHSPTHLCFCETYGGPENLYHWLSRLQNPRPEARPAAFERVAPLLSQLGSAVAFIHTGPHVCHLDIKPENIIVNDVPEAIGLKLTDFDLAVVQREGDLCRRCCGTLPFIAPEVLSGSEYDGMAADVWSEGMVVLEMQCGVRIIDRIVGLRNAEVQSANQVNSDSRKRIAGMIRECFQAPQSAGQYLQQHSYEELQRSVPTLRPLFDGIFSLNPEKRFKAKHVSDDIAAGFAAEQPQ